MPNGNGPAPNQLAKPTPNGASAPFSVEQHTQNMWEQANAQHKQLLASVKRMDSVRRELDSLGKLGDQVQVEDVIKGAGTLVGTGFSPVALAQMLSSMPTTGGQAMQAWIAQQEQQVQSMEAQLRQKVVSSSVHRGISAMAALHVDHIRSKAAKQPGIGGMPQGIPMGGALAPQPGMGAAQAPSPAMPETETGD